MQFMARRNTTVLTSGLLPQAEAAVLAAERRAEEAVAASKASAALADSLRVQLAEVLCLLFMLRAHCACLH